MNVQHFEKGFSYTDRQMLAIVRKIGKLATFCRSAKDEGSFIRLEAERRDTKKERDQIKVILTVQLPKKILIAESRRLDVVEAVDRCTEKLEPQLKKYKDLHSRKGRVQVSRKHARRDD